MVIQSDLKLNKVITLYKERNPQEERAAILSALISEKNRAEHNQLDFEELQPQGGRQQGLFKKKSRNAGRSNPTVKKSKKESNKTIANIFISVVENQKNSFIKKQDNIVELFIIQTLYNSPELKSQSLELIYSLYRDSNTLKNRMNEIQLIQDNK